MSDQSPEDFERINFSQLIDESAAESAVFDDTEASQNYQKLLNHPWAVAITWFACLLVGLLLTLGSPASYEPVGSRSGTVRLNVALYHVAHRVETYRQYTGSLPDYLEADWHETQAIEYKVVDGRYQLTAREGELTIVYQQGDNAEALLFADRGARVGDNE
jgi:hypothetical protein